MSPLDRNPDEASAPSSASALSRRLARLVVRSQFSPLPVLQLYRRWSAGFHDARLNIRTAWTNEDMADDELDVPSYHRDGTAYESPDYRNLYRVFRNLDLGPDDVFYDIGCGKGRVLCLAARQPIRKAVGIEIDFDHCLSARQNAASLRSRRAPIAILCADACHAPLDKGTVYFMFNAFGRNTLTDVLDNLEATVEAEPRPVRIVYYNALHEDALRQRSWLTAYDAFQTLTGRRVSFWRSV